VWVKSFFNCSIYIGTPWPAPFIHIQPVEVACQKIGTTADFNGQQLMYWLQIKVNQLWSLVKRKKS